MLEKAVGMLKSQGHTCVFLKGQEVYISNERGVKPLLTCYDEKRMEKGFYAADKVIGKAAAFLYVLLEPAEIYAGIISEPSLAVLNNAGIKVTYGEKVPLIKNRTGEGFCPMETAVSECKDARAALAAIRRKMEELKKEA